jgi:hypothetical protein
MTGPRNRSEEELRLYRRGVVSLLWLTPVAWVVAHVVAAIGHFADGFGFDSQPVFAFFALAILVTPPVWLLVSAHRLRGNTSDYKGLRIAAAIVAGTSLISGLAIVAQPILGPVAYAARDIFASFGPATAAETEFTPTELKRETEDIIIASLTPFTDSQPAREDLLMQAVECVASNRTNGTRYIDFEYADLTVPADAFRDTAIETWAAMGFELDTSLDPPSRIGTSGGIIEFMELENFGSKAQLSISTVCVVGQVPR